MYVCDPLAHMKSTIPITSLACMTAPLCSASRLRNETLFRLLVLMGKDIGSFLIASAHDATWRAVIPSQASCIPRRTYDHANLIPNSMVNQNRQSSCLSCCFQLLLNIHHNTCSPTSKSSSMTWLNRSKLYVAAATVRWESRFIKEEHKRLFV